MKAKNIITAALLLFVGISIVYLITAESKHDEASLEPPSHAADEEAPTVTAQAEGATETTETTEADKTTETTEATNKVIAYYFHGTKRCPTCRTIEAYADEALQEHFPDDLKTGILEWRVVNVEESENEHFIEDYELTTRSVVLVEIRNGEQTRWKNLTRVWELVRDKEAFFSYIREETWDFLEEEHE